MQERVETELSPLGFPREQRAFSPHITLGRTRANARKIRREEVDRIATEVVYKAKVSVASADLMRSHLSPRGARYEVLYRAELE